jgi:serine/threonine-protein kinase TNNI3K
MENSKTPSTDNAVAKYSLMQDSTVSHIYTDPLISSARIPFDKLKVGECIAKGGFGEVYKGTYKGRIVAIKRLLLESRKDMKHIQAFIAEIRLMAFMEHPNIVQFIGVAWDALSDLSAVTEFMYQGDLRTLLLKYERLGYQHGFNREKIKIVCDIAKGLTYLHSLNPVVVHRDLKSRNVLLDKNLIAKLTDFGVSRESVDHTMTAGVGTGLWMAPEVMTGERYNEKADIFSFGVLLSEIDTHSIPYSHAKIGSDGRTIADTALMQMIVMGKLQVQFSQEAQADIVDVGLSCLSLDPALRPTAPEVSYRMIKVFKTIPR